MKEQLFAKKRSPKGQFAAGVLEPSQDLGPTPELIWVLKEDCYIDERYQRKITTNGISLINKIVREFVWAKFHPLISGPRTKDGYPIIDGQHRLEAALRHPLVDKVPLWVVGTKDVADQAQTFVGSNRDRQAVAAINIFWAAVAANEEDALRIKLLCDEAGVLVGDRGGPQPARTTICLDVIQRSAEKYGPELVIQALKVLVDAQPETDGLLKSYIVDSVIRFVAVYKDMLDFERLQRILSTFNFEDELKRAKEGRRLFGGTIEEQLRKLIVKAYNYQLRENGGRLPENIVVGAM